MRICPNCNESYTYFNSYFGIDMCTSCGWSEDIDNNEEILKTDKSDKVFSILKEKEVFSKIEEIHKSFVS